MFRSTGRRNQWSHPAALSPLYGPRLRGSTQALSSVSVGTHSFRSLPHVCGSSEAAKLVPTLPKIPSGGSLSPLVGRGSGWISCQRVGLVPEMKESCIVRFPVWEVGSEDSGLSWKQRTRKQGLHTSFPTPSCTRRKSKQDASPNHTHCGQDSEKEGVENPTVQSTK